MHPLLDPKKSIAQNRETYNAAAAQFASTRSFLWDDFKDEAFSKYLSLGDQVLDVGCGNGRMWGFFRERQVLYRGVDQSDELIRLAQKHNPCGQFDVGEMTALPYAASSFDALYAIASLHHLPTAELQSRALQEFHRVLRPNGVLLLLNWNLYSDWAKKKFTDGEWQWFTDQKNVAVPWKQGDGSSLGDRVYYAFTEEEMRELCTQNNFTVVDEAFTRRGVRADIHSGDNLLLVARKNAA